MDSILLNLVNGIAFGMLLFLLASGLSVMLGLMGIINLAHGVFFMIGAFIGWTILIQCGLNFGLAVLAGGLGAGIIGLVLERIFLRRLYKQPNEQVLLTLGFLYIFTNLTIWIWGPRPRIPFTAPFLSGSISIGGFGYPMSRFFIIFIGLVLAAGLWWLQDKTRIGAIIRAGMDNKEMTTGLGVNLARVSTSVFFLTAFIAGVAGIIGASVLGANTTNIFEILLLALVVVIIGGVGSIQGTLVGSLLIGLIDNFGKAMFPQFALFTIYLAMVVILIIRPTGLLGRRMQETQEAAPERIAFSSRSGLARFLPYVLGVLILVMLPPFCSTYIQSLLTKCLIFAIFAMSLDIVMGYTGLISLGHAAFFGTGGYVVGVLLLRFGINNFWVVAPLSILIAAAVAAMLGLIALRASAIYFLLLTFALGQLLYSVAWEFDWLHAGGTQGLPGILKPFLGIPNFSWNSTKFYYFVFLSFIICYFFIFRFVNSPFGRALQGIRESEPRMRALGYNTWLYKYVAYIVGGAFAGVAGMLSAYYKGMILAGDLGVTTSALGMLMVIIGGIGTLFGPVLGAFVIVFVEFFASSYTPERWPIILGGAFVATILWLRGGIAIHLTKFWTKWPYGSTKS
jgi:branched-chain amino acid transport system permease protein